MNVKVSGPAPRPCTSCPYRQDVPSGIWSKHDYSKLPAYDLPTPFQPSQLFLCHQTDLDDPAQRVCAGWAGCHDMTHSLAVRIAAARHDLTADETEHILEYRTPVALFASGQEACDHGLADLDDPGPEAIAAMAKVARRRTGLKTLEDL